MNKKYDSFGKDHWSLIAYLGYLASNNNMNIENSRMRCNETNHPLLKWSDKLQDTMIGIV